jgi:hypothetical protein
VRREGGGGQGAGAASERVCPFARSVRSTLHAAAGADCCGRTRVSGTHLVHLAKGALAQAGELLKVGQGGGHGGRREGPSSVPAQRRTSTTSAHARARAPQKAREGKRAPRCCRVLHTHTCLPAGLPPRRCWELPVFLRESQPPPAHIHCPRARERARAQAAAMAVEYAPRHSWGVGTLSRYLATEQIGEGTYGCVRTRAPGAAAGRHARRVRAAREEWRARSPRSPPLSPLPSLPTPRVLQASVPRARCGDGRDGGAEEDGQAPRDGRGAWRGQAGRGREGGAGARAVALTAPAHVPRLPPQFPRTETREIKILNSLRHPNMVLLKELVTSMGASPSLFPTPSPSRARRVSLSHASAAPSCPLPALPQTWT